MLNTLLDLVSNYPRKGLKRNVHWSCAHATYSYQLCLNWSHSCHKATNHEDFGSMHPRQEHSYDKFTALFLGCNCHSVRIHKSIKIFLSSVLSRAKAFWETPC